MQDSETAFRLEASFCRVKQTLPRPGRANNPIRLNLAGLRGGKEPLFARAKRAARLFHYV
jgi:hypothetical protein